jgi:septal ring factor EnvC (AmiA/AmiB activator)
MSAPAYPRSNKHFSPGFCPDTAVGNPEHSAPRVSLRYIRLIALLFLMLPISASDKEPGDYREEAARSSEEWVKETQQNYHALKNYALQKQKEFRQQTEAELARYEERIEKLRAEIERATTEAQRKLNEINEEWKKNVEDLKQQLEESKTRGAELWEQAEKRINAGLQELRRLYERARSTLS